MSDPSVCPACYMPDGQHQVACPALLPFTDEQVLAAISSQVPNNPTGCSAIDALIGLGIYQATEVALERLRVAGRLRATSPGNYLPAIVPSTTTPEGS